jgi:hypothetical protein
MTVSKPSLGIYPTVSMQISSPIMLLSESSLGHPSSATYEYIYDTNDGDCYILTGTPSSYSEQSSSLYFGNGMTGSYKAWIPFESINEIGMSDPIAYAYILLTSKQVGSESTNVGLQFGCERLRATWVGDTSNYPTTYTDLNSRTMTSAVTIIPSPMALWGQGNLLIYDVTDSVQECINDSYWNHGLALMVFNYNSGSGDWSHCRRAYSHDEGASWPRLMIGFN